MTSFKIGQRSIGTGSAPFIIAEMSGNHNQSLEVALQIVEAAAKAGAHALKLQTYTADTMTLDLDHGEFFIKDPDSLWTGSSLYALYEKAHTPWEWHAPIFARAKALGMLAFSTPFDESAVDFLESLDVPAYKIASFENTDLPLIRRVAATGKPMIMSTGMASVAELDDSVRAARAAGCKNLVLLKCTSTYPASPVNSHLRTIPHLRELFGCEVGLSDHSMGVGVSVAAVALGATVIEKHFTLDRSAGGVDSSFSLEPAELASLVIETERAWQALGHVHYGVTDAERKSLVYRRSLYVTKDMAAGEIFSPDNIRAIRPGLGLAPKHIDAVTGRHAREPLQRGTPLGWSMVQ
jgi:pseudaminic acid synthase